MTKITFIQHDGQSHLVEVSNDQTLMQAAIDNGVPGIDGDCGGSCACGTCHIIVPDAWLKNVGTASEGEESMLGLTPDVQPGSRLACQVEVSDDLDGLEVHLPEFQM